MKMEQERSRDDESLEFVECASRVEKVNQILIDEPIDRTEHMSTFVGKTHSKRYVFEKDEEANAWVSDAKVRSVTMMQPHDKKATKKQIMF